MSEKRKLANKLSKAKFDLKNDEIELKNRELPRTPGEYIGEHGLVSLRARVAALREWKAKLENGEDAERPDLEKVTATAMREYELLHIKAKGGPADFNWETFVKMMDIANTGNKYVGLVPFYALFLYPDELHKRMPQLLAWEDERKVDLQIANDPSQVTQPGFIYKHGDRNLYYVAIRDGGVLEPQKPEKPAKKRAKKPPKPKESPSSDVQGRSGPEDLDEELEAAAIEEEDEEAEETEEDVGDNLPLEIPEGIVKCDDWAKNPEFIRLYEAFVVWLQSPSVKPGSVKSYRSTGWDWPGYCLAHGVDFFNKSPGVDVSRHYANFFSERFSDNPPFIVNLGGILKQCRHKMMGQSAINERNLHIRLIAYLSSKLIDPEHKIAANYLTKDIMREYITAEDVRSMKHGAKEKKGFHDALTGDEIRAIWDYLKEAGTEDDRVAFHFAIDTGLRSGEMAPLQWGNIWKTQQIEVIREKTKREPRTVPIPQALYDKLLALKARRQKEGLAKNEDYVFLKPKIGTPYMRKPTVQDLKSMAIVKARQKEILAIDFDPTKIDWLQDDTYIIDGQAFGQYLKQFISAGLRKIHGKDTSAEIKRRRLTTHCLRSTFCTRMWNQIRDIVKVALLMGHQTAEGTPNVQMTQKYIHVQWLELKAFFEQQEQNGGSLSVLNNAVEGLFEAKSVQEIQEKYTTLDEKARALTRALKRVGEDIPKAIEITQQLEKLEREKWDYLTKTAVPEMQTVIRKNEEQKRIIEGQTLQIRELLSKTVKDINIQTVMTKRMAKQTHEEIKSDWIDKAHKIRATHKTDAKRFGWRKVAIALEKEIGVLVNHKTLWSNVVARYPEDR